MAAQEEGTQKRIEKTVEGPVCFSETQLVLFFCRQWAGATQQPNHVLKDNVSSLQQRKGLENNGKVPGHTKTAWAGERAAEWVHRARDDAAEVRKVAERQQV